ncbi:55 kDa erythrocyte membrane protein [Coelomomyces lativittatus]|nr:55 kDa erythrocyte membrane protein [Coelomomyces lativittatus]
MGAQLNAYTSREQTVYYSKLFSNDIEKGVHLLSDLLTNYTLEPSAIEREKNVILRELEEVENNMDETIFDHLHATAFQKNPLGYTILGPRENIRSFGQWDLKKYILKNYTPNRMVLVGVGNVEHAKLCEIANKNFGHLASPSSSSSSSSSSSMSSVLEKPKFEAPDFTGSEVRYRVDDMPTAHIAIAVEGCGWNHPDHFPLLVASCMVGSYDRAHFHPHPSSHLAQLVSKHHLANAFMSFNTTYSDTGLWGIYLTTNNRSQMDDLVHFTIREWMRLATFPSSADVEQAKQHLKTSFLLNLDGTTAIAEEIGRHMLVYGRRMTPYEIYTHIDQVTTEDIKRVAQHYIYDRDPAVVSIGPVENVPDYNRIRSAMNLLRF